MPNLNGLDAARQISETAPQTRVLILTMHESEQIVREVLEVGARGFLLEIRCRARPRLRHSSFAAPHHLLHLQRRRDGAERLSRPAWGSPQKPSKDRLTPREREVVQLLAEGKSSKEVAVVLNLSVKTAETHRTNVMRKLDLHSVADLVRYAVRNNLVQVA